MVKLCRGELLSFIEQLRGQRVFCFGGGKIFRSVFHELTRVNVEGIIDNYLSKDKNEITVDGQTFAVISFDRYVQIAEPDDVIVITSLFYRDILQQLDGEKRLDDTKCFVAANTSEQEIDKLIEERKTLRDVKASQVVNSDGRHFQIWEFIADNMHAGSKAPRDVRDILAGLGYVPINVHVERCTGSESDDNPEWRRNRSQEEWQNCVDSIPDGSVLVLQNPFRVENIYREKAILELKEKDVRIVSIVHDIESIRGLNSSGYFTREEEFMLQTADIIVAQNKKMRGYLETRSAGKSNTVELGIFDYLGDCNDTKEKVFDRMVNFAGSLEYRKSPFLYKLGELAQTSFSLYGPDFEQDRFKGGVIPPNIEYKGAYPPEEMPERLAKGFGLVWEGEELDTCDKGTGHYLTMNSPHKLSLYLASGLPVIIWAEAAMAEFVLENEIGFVVSSLNQLEDRLAEVTKEDYFRYAANARRIGQRLRNGEYTKTAIKEAEGLLKIQRKSV